MKSIVWYPKQAYEAGGCDKAPATIQELQTNVADKIKATGISPWCMGWESDQATGWVGTDWIEELMLRMHGPDVYDDWVAHRIPFNDERVVQAFDEFAKIAKDPTQVLGGPKGVLNTAFGDAMTPAFAPNPRCMIHRQGNFATTFYPSRSRPTSTTAWASTSTRRTRVATTGNAILGGGDLAALFNGNDPDAQAVMKFLTSDQFGDKWAKPAVGSRRTRTFDVSNYPNETTRQIAEIANQADVLRFDGSDLMPKEVGSGTFWTEMVKWENGQDSQETADNIEKSWPK